MVKGNHISIELKNLITADGTLPLPIISIGGEQGLTPDHAARALKLTDIELRRIIKELHIETRKLSASALAFLKEAEVISPKVNSSRFITRAGLYQIVKVIGTRRAVDTFAAIWRTGRPFDAHSKPGKVLSPKAHALECQRQLLEQEKRLAVLEEQYEKLNDFLMDVVTLELKSEETRNEF